MTTASPLHTGSRFSGTELDLPSSWAAGARAAAIALAVGAVLIAVALLVLVALAQL